MKTQNEDRTVKIEAYGAKGMKNTPWRKTFKNWDELEKWLEKHDAEVYGTREIPANER